MELSESQTEKLLNIAANLRVVGLAYSNSQNNEDKDLATILYQFGEDITSTIEPSFN